MKDDHGTEEPMNRDLVLPVGGGTKMQGQVPSIRQSSYNTFNACQRLWFLRHVLCLRPTQREVRRAADVGTYWHEYMRARYVAYSKHPDWDADAGGGYATASVGVLLQNDLDALRVAAAEDLSGEVAAVMRSLQECADKAIVMGHIFWRRHPIGPDSAFTVQDVELDVDVELEGVPCGGRLDLVLRDAKGRLWLVDHKSSTKPLSQAIYGRPWAFQCQWYTWLAYQHYGQWPGGFIYNLMLQPTIKKCGKDEKTATLEGITTEGAYLQRVAKWYADYPEPVSKATWIPIHHLPDRPSVSELHEATCRVRGNAKDGAMWVGECDHTMRTCRGMFKPCAYLPFCDTDPAAWPAVPGFEQRFEEVADVEEKEEVDA